MKKRLIFILCISLSHYIYAEDFIGKVISVADGDTVTVLTLSKQTKIRLAEIDTPEKNQTGHEFSKKKLKKKIGNLIVICVREKNKDYWGRTVAECFVNGESISIFMVKNGYACDYVKYSKKKYAKQQEYAKTKKLGIWKMKFDPSWENKCRKK